MTALREALPDSIGWWLLGLVMLCWFVGAYNRIVRLRSAAIQAWGGLHSAVQRQMDFVQARLAAPDEHVSESNPEDTHASRAARAEADARKASVQAALVQLSTLLGSTRARPLHAAGMAALGTALQVLIATWQGLHPLAAGSMASAMASSPSGAASRPMPLETSAAPSAPTAPTARHEEESPLAWPDPAAGTDVARHQFNDAVMQYNRAIRQFPALLVAWIMQLRPAGPLR